MVCSMLSRTMLAGGGEVGFGTTSSEVEPLFCLVGAIGTVCIAQRSFEPGQGVQASEGAYEGVTKGMVGMRKSHVWMGPYEPV